MAGGRYIFHIAIPQNLSAAKAKAHVLDVQDKVKEAKLFDETDKVVFLGEYDSLNSYVELVP